MRVLLTSTAAFVPPRGGSTRSNRVWLEYLAAHGHTCKVVCAAATAAGPEQVERIKREAGSQGFTIDAASSDATLTLPSGIEVSLHRELARRSGVLTRHVHAFQPDWVLVSSEDLGHALLREAGEAAPGRVVYLAHTPQFLPFGPESWAPDTHATERVRAAAATVVIGHHMAGYVHKHLSVDAHVIHPSIYGSGPFESYSNFDQGFVLAVNPCAVKGISIFAELAKSMQHVRFAALPGWGTTSQDCALLSSFSNVELLEPVRRIEQVLERTRVLLMPSLWYEGFGLIVMEAMLRGIPVISSDSGGLVEAKQGTSFVIPVERITRYLPEFNEVRMPTPVIPVQDVSAWRVALGSLLWNRVAYEQEAERSREVATDFVYGLRASALEQMLLALRPRVAEPVKSVAERMEHLSAEQRGLLLARLKAKRVQV